MDNKYILIINGYPRSGKDTFCNILTKISSFPVFTASWVDKIKIIAPSYGWDGKKDFKGRKLLADLTDNNGEECFEFIVNKEETISNAKNSFIYCVHARRPDDIEKLVNFYSKPGYKVITICVRREIIENISQSNTADSEVLDYFYDYHISNDYENKDWREEFKENIKIFYNEILKD